LPATTPQVALRQPLPGVGGKHRILPAYFIRLTEIFRHGIPADFTGGQECIRESKASEPLSTAGADSLRALRASWLSRHLFEIFSHLSLSRTCFEKSLNHKRLWRLGYCGGAGRGGLAGVIHYNLVSPRLVLSTAFFVRSLHRQGAPNGSCKASQQGRRFKRGAFLRAPLAWLSIGGESGVTSRELIDHPVRAAGMSGFVLLVGRQ
jgi:hypothetical protein